MLFVVVVAVDIVNMSCQSWNVALWNSGDLSTEAPVAEHNIFVRS